MYNSYLKYEHNDLNDLDFFQQHQVHKEPLQTLDDRPVDNAFALIREDGSLASDTAVTGTYTLTNHFDLYSKHNDIIEGSNLPYHNVKVIDEVTPNGLKARRSVRYLDTARDVVKANDPITCRSDVVNSVNQTWAFQMFSGAYRSFCENSMVFGGDKIAYAKQKHSRHFDPMLLLRTANETLQDYEKNSERFREWNSVTVTDEMAMKFLADNFCVYPETELRQRAAEMVGATDEDIKYNKKKLATMLVLWNQYKSQLGTNKWALYNAITHYATHTHETYTVSVENKHGETYETEHTTGRITKKTPQVEHSEGGKANTLSEQHDRSRLVAIIVTKPEFQQLAA